MKHSVKETIRRTLALRELQRRNLAEFCVGVRSDYQMAPHVREVASALTAAVAGDPKYRRVIVHFPPQHGKTLLISKLFPAWLLGNKPETNFIVTAYNDDYATSFGREIRNIICSEAYQLIFPGISIAPDAKAAGRWNVAGQRGGVMSSGIFGGITGNPANFLIIDDPYKLLEEAESADYRKKVVDIYKTVLSTRLHANAPVWLVMTRWNNDDLAGWLLRESGEPWTYIKYPALAQANDPLGRRRMEPLWRWRRDQASLRHQRTLMGTYLWGAMYQGDPAPLEGLLFKRRHFRVVGPLDVPGALDYSRYWDLACTEDKKADPTASLKGAYTDNGALVLRDGLWGRWEWPEVRTLIRLTALAEPGVRVGLEAQGMQKGMLQEAYRDKRLRRVGMLGFKVSKSKRIRAYPLVARGEAGLIVLVDGPWTEAFIKEAIEFDNGAHDDWVDAATGVNHMLGVLHGFGFNLPDDADAKGEDPAERPVIRTWYEEDTDKEEAKQGNVIPFAAADHPYWEEMSALQNIAASLGQGDAPGKEESAGVPWFVAVD